MRGWRSWLLTVVVGLVGAFLGWLVFTGLFGIGDTDMFDLGGLIGAVIGAVVVLLAVSWFLRPDALHAAVIALTSTTGTARRVRPRWPRPQTTSDGHVVVDGRRRWAWPTRPGDPVSHSGPSWLPSSMAARARPWPREQCAVKRSRRRVEARGAGRRTRGWRRASARTRGGNRRQRTVVSLVGRHASWR